MTMTEHGPSYPQPDFGRRLARTLTRIERALALIQRNQEIMMSDMDKLEQTETDLVQAVKDSTAEMDELLTELKNAHASGDAARIQKVTSDMQAAIDALKSATSRDAPSGAGP